MKEVEVYAKIETYEHRLAHVYIAFHTRFKDRTALAKFWSDAALEEMQHGAILRFCREHGYLTRDLDQANFEHIQNLLETVASVSRKQDLTVNEAFYASLLMEASELDDVYSKLVRGLLPDHRILYDAIQANLRTHHDAFAEAADRFLGDPAFVEAFRELAHKHLAP